MSECTPFLYISFNVDDKPVYIELTYIGDHKMVINQAENYLDTQFQINHLLKKKSDWQQTDDLDNYGNFLDASIKKHSTNINHDALNLLKKPMLAFYTIDDLDLEPKFFDLIHIGN